MDLVGHEVRCVRLEQQAVKRHVGGRVLYGVGAWRALCDERREAQVHVTELLQPGLRHARRPRPAVHVDRVVMWQALRREEVWQVVVRCVCVGVEGGGW